MKLLSKPLLLHYFVTNRCNSACEFCTIWKEMPKVDAKLSDVIQNLYLARKAGCRFVDFTGGEPLLNPYLPQMLVSAKELGFITSITTNCILFEKLAAKLSGFVDLLHFSLDADNAALHDSIRGGIPSFRSVQDSITAALKHNLVPDLLFTYSERNINSFEGVYRLARHNKLMVILDPVFNIHGADILDPKIHAKAVEYSRRPGVYLNTAHIALRKMGGNSRRKPLCHATESTIVILPNNTIALPCYHHCVHRVTIQNNLQTAIESVQRKESLKMQGKYEFCENCHINCYFDPSYLYKLSSLTLKSLASKFRYSFTKYIVYRRPWIKISHLWRKPTQINSKLNYNPRTY